MTRCGRPTTLTLSQIGRYLLVPLPFFSTGADQYSATPKLLSHIKPALSVSINTILCLLPPRLLRSPFVSHFHASPSCSISLPTAVDCHPCLSLYISTRTRTTMSSTTPPTPSSFLPTWLELRLDNYIRIVHVFHHAASCEWHSPTIPSRPLRVVSSHTRASAQPARFTHVPDMLSFPGFPGCDAFFKSMHVTIGTSSPFCVFKTQSDKNRS